MPISRFISRAACVSLLLALPALCPTGWLDGKAQAQQKDIVASAADTIPTFRGLALSVDAVGPIQKAVGSYGQAEAALRVNLKDTWFPIVEMGYGKADADDAASRLTYKTSAPYARIGIDLNVLRNKHDTYRLYAGGRYAFSSFKYDVTSPPIQDPVWSSEAAFDIKGSQANCHWIEAVVGVDAQIWHGFRLGWSVRYKLRMAHDDGPGGSAWYVPGYGRQGSTRLGGTFNITFEMSRSKGDRRR